MEKINYCSQLKQNIFFSGHAPISKLKRGRGKKKEIKNTEPGPKKRIKKRDLPRAMRLSHYNNLLK